MQRLAILIMELFFSDARYRLLLALTLGSLLIPGCGGCTGGGDQSADNGEEQTEEEKQDADEDEKEQSKKKKKDDFELKEMIVKPNDPGDESNQQAESQTLSKIGYVKPGHWTTGSLPVIANNFDFQGNLVARCLDSSGRQIETENTHYQLTITRPVSLPKGQEKELEVTYYVPRRFGSQYRTVSLGHELRSRSGGLLFAKTQGGILMPEYEYYMVVLSTTPGSFKYLELLDCVKVPGNDDREVQFYRVTFPTIKQQVPLPNHSLNWTSIAYLVWDDLDPALLTPDQEQALLDWLHFGGQLIVNGPAGLDKLQNSFLGEHLPVKSSQVKNLTAADVEELNAAWSIPQDKKKTIKRRLQLTEETKLIGLDLELNPAGSFLEQTGQLVAEGRVGRGRIVVTGFAMNSRQVINWQSWDGFFNSCLLRRPAKRYTGNEFGDPTFAWQEGFGPLVDPMQSTTLRYISRDLGASGTPTSGLEQIIVGETVDEEINEGSPSGGRQKMLQMLPGNTSAAKQEITRENIDRDPWHYGGFRNHAQSGVAGWNDSSGVSTAARDILKESAGIVPPSADFVLKVLLVYLVVLVPANWLFFRLLGRLEWAWVAAPIIAVSGTVLVVKLASLDIGFARSRTEIAVFEMYGGYPRGHLTRYSALYTSLSSKYDLEFEEGTTQAQPFGSSTYNSRKAGEANSEVEFRRETNWKLQAFRVQSNSTAVVHSEQMHDAGGTIQLTENAAGAFQLENTTEMDLHDVGIWWRDASGRQQKAWLGELQANGGPQPVVFQIDPHNSPRFAQWSESASAESIVNTGNRLFQEFDENKDLVLTRKEVEHLPEVARVFGIVDNQNYQARSQVIPKNMRADDRLSLPEFIECLLLSSTQEEISLGVMFDMVGNNLQLAKGECRLAGWTSSTLAGMQITPAASQSSQKTFVLVHLLPGELPAPQRDSNSRFDFTLKEESRQDF